MASVVVITGAYPTTAPSGLATNVLVAEKDGVNFSLVVASGTDTFYGLGYQASSSKWVPLVTLASNSAVTGGVIHGRVRSLGRPTPAYSHYAIWRDGGSVTPTTVDIECVRGES